MSVSATEFRDTVLKVMREATPSLLEAFYTKLQEPGIELDDLRKALDLTLRTTGVEVKEKTDNLPTVNITIVNNRTTVESVAPPLEVLEDITDLPTFTPTVQPQRAPVKRLVAPIDINADLDGLLND